MSLQLDLENTGATVLECVEGTVINVTIQPTSYQNYKDCISIFETYCSSNSKEITVLTYVPDVAKMKGN